MIADNLNRTADLIAFHVPRPDQDWKAIRANQIDLGLAIAKNVHMGRFVIVSEDDDAQPICSIDGNHKLTLTHLDGLIKVVSLKAFFVV